MSISPLLEQHLDAISSKERIGVLIRAPQSPSQFLREVLDGKFIGSAAALTQTLSQNHVASLAPIEQYLQEHEAPYEQHPRLLRTLVAYVTVTEVQELNQQFNPEILLYRPQMHTRGQN
jgi:hypothetical protein